MSSHKAKKKPLHVAYQDISKAYDTINHDQLWNICQENGIEGRWLDNLKQMYESAILTALTRHGKTRGVKMQRGIRQGCPLSPVLFALYVQPIAEQLQEMMIEEGTYKRDKPNMLFYADDMVLWGNTKEELQQKLTRVVETMEQLGLQISIGKTELQCNEHAETQEKEMNIKTSEGTKAFKYVSHKQAIRYLGYWSTVDMEERKK